MNPFTEEAAVEALKDADAGLIDVETYDKSIFSKIHERTKLLIRFGVGFDAVNLQDAAEYGIKVARTQGANATGVAEYALLLIMALRRKLLSGNRGVREGDWTKEIGNETVGSTVGILELSVKPLQNCFRALAAGYWPTITGRIKRQLKN